MSLLSLPLDITENILVFAAADGHPTSIAAFSSTCRRYRELVYGAADHRLWREIFLSSFDDPRHCQFVDLAAKFDWALEYRQRIWALLYLRRHTRPLPVQKVYSLRSRKNALSLVDFSKLDKKGSQRVLDVLSSVIMTATPCSPYPLTDELRSFTHQNGLEYAHKRTPMFPPPTYTSEPSLNIKWLYTVLELGLPPLLSVTFSLESPDPTWDDSGVAQSLGKVIAFTGYTPIRELLEHPSAPSPRSPAQRGRRGPRSSGLNHGSAQILELDMTEDAQRTRARHLARQRVYDMSYLSRRRAWGPFLYVPRAERGRGIPGTNTPSSAASDSDYVPREGSSSSASVTSSSGSSHVSSHASAAEAPKRRSSGPTAEQLRPDWSWLAAVRVLSEFNMIEKEYTNELQDLCNWGRLREAAWVRERPPASSHNMSWPSTGATGLNKPDDTSCQIMDADHCPSMQHGWDWAGVEGVWRRCVFWLDYADVANFHIHGQFPDDLQEEMLIVPLRLRITGYSPSVVAAYPDRSTIHVEGEMGGASWNDETGEDVRRLKGTVSVVGDGSVRWSIYSSEEGNPTQWQWSSEAVQLGGVGSSMGIIGLWTGAFHDGMDPIGAFWQWRVV